MNRHDGFEDVCKSDAYAGHSALYAVWHGTGADFAVLCLTIGVGAALLIALFCLIGAFIGGVKDKKKFVESVYLFFQHDENSRY